MQHESSSPTQVACRIAPSWIGLTLWLLSSTGCIARMEMHGGGTYMSWVPTESLTALVECCLTQFVEIFSRTCDMLSHITPSICPSHYRRAYTHAFLFSDSIPRESWSRTPQGLSCPIPSDMPSRPVGPRTVRYARTWGILQAGGGACTTSDNHGRTYPLTHRNKSSHPIASSIRLINLSSLLI
jgi:hypothetical protein